MFKIRLSQAKSVYLVLLTCLAVALGTETSTSNVEAAKPGANNLKMQRSSTPTTVNGKLVFSSDRNKDNGLKIWSFNPDGSNPTQLTFDSERNPDMPSYASIYDDLAKWSPDGTKIALRSNRDFVDPDHAPGSYTIYIMDATGKNTQRLTLDKLPGLSGVICPEISSFEWSPDGTKFLLSFGKIISGVDVCPGILDTNIYTVNTDGSSLVKLTKDVGTVNSNPTWSPDGSQIAFSSWDQKGTFAIHVMNADGSKRHEIVRSRMNDFLSTAWSPDGSKILFYGNKGDVASCYTVRCFQLYTINPDGTAMRQLTHSPFDYETPRWSPDGTKIAFVRDLTYAISVWVNRGSAIFIMNADGSDEHEVSDRGPGDFGDASIDWQPLMQPGNDPPPSGLGFNEGIYSATYPAPAKVQITITRSGDLSQTVSCDYQTRSDSGINTGPSGSLTFAPGEVSRTIDFSAFYFTSSLNRYRISLYNNAGNTTFLGGIRVATLLFLGQNTNPIDDSTFFARQHYEDFLSREPDAPGWEFWTNNIDVCGSGGTGAACRNAKRIDESAAFFLSIEFQNTGYLVERIYKAAYGDANGGSTLGGAHLLPVPTVRFNEFLPDTQQIGQGVVVGQSGWETVLEYHKQAFVAQFVQRSRFATALPTSLTPTQFVDKLNQNAGNVLSSSERATAIGFFGSATDTSNPMARAQALRQVSENQNLYSAEFNRAFVLMEYFGYLRRNVNESQDTDYSGYDFWLQKLNQFNGDYQKSEMVKAFISSSEYRKRFEP